MSSEKRLRSINREAREAEEKREAEKELPAPLMTPDDKKALHELDQDRHAPALSAQVAPNKGAHSRRGDAPKEHSSEI